MKTSFLSIGSIGIAAMSSLQLLHANPSDPTVIAGDVNFDTSGNTLTVSSDSTRSIIDWDSFSIGLTETTTFELPSSSSAILNRVTGESASTILGNLDCNGSLFLLNPNGIVFGANSVVSAASFLAASMSMDDNDAFLYDTAMTFTSDDDTNINVTALGEINASTGDVVLIGYRVEHYSDTSAPNGFVALGAGVETTFRSWDDPRIAVAPGSPGTPGDTGIGLGGTIEALRAFAYADGGFYTYAINVDDTIRTAGGVSGDAMVRIEAPGGLVSVSGDISATNYSGNYGGVVDILGETIVVYGSTNIDTSAEYGNGAVYIGGGYQGNDPSRFNADNVTIENGATIDASAISAGQGGTVVVWADDTTEFYGAISATGGSTSGDGGTVEVSGVQNLYYYGTTDVSAPNGTAGTLLLDPINLEYAPVEREGMIQAIPTIQ